MLLDDSLRAMVKAQECGTEVHVTVWRDVPHNFPYMDVLKEAITCRSQIADFISRILN